MRKFLFAALLVATPAFAELTPAPEGARVFFANIEDGAAVTSPVEITYGIEGMSVAPAGTEEADTGHHHLLVDRPPLGEGEDGADELVNGLPADEQHVHFGKGQTEVSLELPPGEHTLQLVLGDHAHVPHDPPVVSDVITITVE